MPKIREVESPICPPRTWSLSSGSLPAGLALSSTGVLSGAPTTTGSSSFTVQVKDAAGTMVGKTFSVPVTSRSDYATPGFDLGHTGYEPSETSLSTTAVNSLHVDWAMPKALGTVAVVGGIVYAATHLPGSADSNENQLAALQLTTGSVIWKVPLGCGGSDVAVTGAAVLVQCGDGVRAYSLTGTHAMLWNTARVDPSASVTGFSVLADRVIVDGYFQVAAYRLADGVRLWRQLINANNGGGQGIAVGSSIAVVPIGDRLRAFATDTGAIKWTVMQPATSASVAGSVVYATLNGQLYALNLTTGTTVWHVTPDFYAARVLAVDGSRIYVDVEEDNGVEVVYHLTAYARSSGAFAWRTDVDEPRTLTVANGLLYLGWAYGGFAGTEGGTEVYAATDGSLVRLLENGRSGFAGTPVVAAGHYLAAHYDGLYVYGFAPPLPTVTQSVLRTAWVGSPYSQTLAASGGTPKFTWSLKSGTLPAGLSLTSTGLLNGTPTAATTARVVVGVSDKRGMKATAPLTIEVRAAAAGAWPTLSGTNARSGLAAGETVISLDSYPQLAQLWTTPANGNNNVWGDTVVSGGRAYVSADSTHNGTSVIKIYAYSTTGTTTGTRSPLWSARTDDGSANGSGVTVSGTTAYVVANDGLYAFNATTGSRRWKAPLASLDPPYAPLVLGSTVFVSTSDGSGYVAAYDTATGAAKWASVFRPRLEDTAYYNSINGALATDGTRIYAIGGCTVSAIDPTDGSLLWDRVLSPGASDADCGTTPTQSTPLVDHGIVYAASYSVIVALDATTGSLIWRRDTESAGVMALSDGVLVHACLGGGTDMVLCGTDASTGAPLWAQTSYAPAAIQRISVAGDLVFTPTTDGLMSGFDLRTGELAWQSDSLPSAYVLPTQAAVADGHIYFEASDRQLYAYGLP